MVNRSTSGPFSFPCSRQELSGAANIIPHRRRPTRTVGETIFDDELHARTEDSARPPRTLGTNQSILWSPGSRTEARPCYVPRLDLDTWCPPERQIDTCMIRSRFLLHVLRSAHCRNHPCQLFSTTPPLRHWIIARLTTVLIQTASNRKCDVTNIELR